MVAGPWGPIRWSRTGEGTYRAGQRQSDVGGRQTGQRTDVAVVGGQAVLEIGGRRGAVGIDRAVERGAGGGDVACRQGGHGRGGRRAGEILVCAQRGARAIDPHQLEVIGGTRGQTADEIGDGQVHIGRRQRVGRAEAAVVGRKAVMEIGGRCGAVGIDRAVERGVGGGDAGGRQGRDRRLPHHGNRAIDQQLVCPTQARRQPRQSDLGKCSGKSRRGEELEAVAQGECVRPEVADRERTAVYQRAHDLDLIVGQGRAAAADLHGDVALQRRRGIQLDGADGGAGRQRATGIHGEGADDRAVAGQGRVPGDEQTVGKGMETGGCTAHKISRGGTIAHGEGLAVVHGGLTGVERAALE